MHQTSSSGTRETFKLDVKTSAGDREIFYPTMHLGPNADMMQ